MSPRYARCRWPNGGRAAGRSTRKGGAQAPAVVGLSPTTPIPPRREGRLLLPAAAEGERSPQVPAGRGGVAP
eukprot:108598-Pyramimonas_sp.AAC.1